MATGTESGTGLPCLLFYASGEKFRSLKNERRGGSFLRLHPPSRGGETDRRGKQTRCYLPEYPGLKWVGKELYHYHLKFCGEHLFLFWRKFRKKAEYFHFW